MSSAGKPDRAHDASAPRGDSSGALGRPGTPTLKEEEFARLPVDLGGGPFGSAAEVACGSAHSCALLQTGAVKCWGSNVHGELGLGDARSRGAAWGEMGDRLPATNLGFGEEAVEISAGNHHSCARLRRGGRPKCWGANLRGQLGLGDETPRGKAPEEMGDALPSVDLGPGREAVQLACGGSHSCALQRDGAVKCWGHHAHGQLGVFTLLPRAALCGPDCLRVGFPGRGAGACGRPGVRGRGARERGREHHGVVLACCWRAAAVLLACSWRAPGGLPEEESRAVRGLPGEAEQEPRQGAAVGFPWLPVYRWLRSPFDDRCAAAVSVRGHLRVKRGSLGNTMRGDCSSEQCKGGSYLGFSWSVRGCHSPVFGRHARGREQPSI